MGDAQEASWKRCGNTPFYRRISPAMLDGGVYADPFAGQLVTWQGYPESGGPDVQVTFVPMPQDVHPEVVEEGDKRIPEETAMALSEFLLYMDLLRMRGFSEDKVIESIDEGFGESKKQFAINSFVRVISEYGPYSKPETRIVSREELDEVLAGYGISGC